MIDTLENFDFASIYQQYDDPTPEYGRFRNKLIEMNLDPEMNDRKLYYHLKKRFSNRVDINIYDYIALLFWKLNFLPQNTVWKDLLNNQESREAEAKKLSGLLKLFPDTLDLNRDKVAIESVLQQEQNYQLCGMATNTAWPTRSVFLHFLYPNTIPIFDQMVLRAVEPNFQPNDKDTEKRDKFSEYIKHVWNLTEKYAEQIKQIENLRDTDIRIVEMALWIKKGHNH